jgi:hypothetical protein
VRVVNRVGILFIFNLRIVNRVGIEELNILLSLLFVEIVKLLLHLLFLNFEGQIVLNFFHKVSRVQ